MTDRTTEHVTCLGCGCACDDIRVVVTRDRITETSNACTLGAAWFGDGAVPAEIRVNGRAATLNQAIDKTAALLAGARRPLVYIAGDVSCETQREAVAIADRLHAAVDSLAATAAGAVLAGQRRGRATATLGEIRQQADVIVFWGVDPGERYPRFTTRYTVGPSTREKRTVVAVDVGPTRGPKDADLRLTLAAADEVDALGVMRATVGGHDVDSKKFGPAGELARRMMRARYAAIVADGEPGVSSATIDPDRAEALVALAQALNGPTRCALSTLRAGGNRSGADAVLTWQTGFPFAVDFAEGIPRYRPNAGAHVLLAGDEVDAALVVGASATLPGPVAEGLSGKHVAVVGPRASRATFPPVVAIDTGVAGIHEGGTAFRMDDVPLPLRASLDGPEAALHAVRAIRERLGARSVDE